MNLRKDVHEVLLVVLEMHEKAVELLDTFVELPPLAIPLSLLLPERRSLRL